MYSDALSFLEDERDAWRPYEDLFNLTPAQLEAPVAGPDHWPGRGGTCGCGSVTPVPE